MIMSLTGSTCVNLCCTSVCRKECNRVGWTRAQVSPNVCTTVCVYERVCTSVDVRVCKQARPSGCEQQEWVRHAWGCCWQVTTIFINHSKISQQISQCVSKTFQNMSQNKSVGMLLTGHNHINNPLFFFSSAMWWLTNLRHGWQCIL